MSQILIRRRHALTRGQARRVANAIAEELAAHYDVQASWTGDALHFKRTGLDGTLRLGSGEFTLNVRLGFVLAAFRDRISEAIRSRLDTVSKTLFALSVIGVANTSASAYSISVLKTNLFETQ